MRRTLPIVLAIAGCASHPVAPGGVTDDANAPLPADLRDTGLYSDWASRTVDPANRPYTPAFALWSDGTAKSRWIHLPPGTRIDVTNLDEWQFPVGTKLWKEFRRDPDQLLETRLLRKKSDGSWDMVSYVWSADQQSALLAPATAPPPVPLPGTASYEVPVLRCKQCHDQRQDKVLGFEAALLAAPEADPDGLTWAKLVDADLVESSVDLPPEAALQLLPSGQPVERQAIAYLHVNCGILCHHASSDEKTPFHMRLEWGASGPLPARVEDTEVYKTAIGVKSDFVPMGRSGTFYRIRPGDDTRSTVYYRMSVRNGLEGGGEQMPPIASHEVDPSGLKLIDDWIKLMTGAPYPSP